MLRKYFSPVLLLLIGAAAVVYWQYGPAPRIRDVRSAVPVEHFRLSNGLEVVVMPNARIPAVTHMLVVKAGGADDPYGKSGVAHYNEHLMFSGTKNYPEGVYSQSINRVGGTHNAYTTKDYTLYYATVATPHLRMVMAMESDRLQQSAFTAEHAARELKVVSEERNMRVENNAAAQLAEQLTALTFINHPYRQPTIGWQEDIATYTAADAQDFFNRYYRASNMVLVVAGDVTARDVRRYAQRYYGGLPAGAAPVRQWPQEPPIRLVRHAEMEDAKVREPQLLRQYVAPSAIYGTTTDAMPLMVFAQYLGGGTTGVLYETLVRNQKIATSVSAQYDALARGPALFRIVATPAPGVTLEALEGALDQAIAAAITATPDAAAIIRSKTLLKAEAIFAQDGLMPLAQVMGELYALGLNERYFYEWADAIEQVSAAQMQSAAQKLLAPSRRVTGFLRPPAPALTAVPAPTSPLPATPVLPEGPYVQ